MALVEAGPAAADVEGLARWRCDDLAAQIKARWHVTWHLRRVAAVAWPVPRSKHHLVSPGSRWTNRG